MDLLTFSQVLRVYNGLILTNQIKSYVSQVYKFLWILSSL